jgi:hypothetical protein
MMSRIYSWHWKISSGRHFQNGHHNTAQIQHCPISTTFYMWVDYDAPNLFPQHWKISTGCHFQNGHHNTAQIQHCPISTTFHMWVDWCPKFIPDIEKFLPVAIFKMATTIPHKFNIVRFQWHFMWVDYNVPNLFSTLNNFNNVQLITDIEKFQPVSIFKMATTMPQKFNIVRFQR